MSIEYYIKEHMIIRDTANAYEPFCALCEEMQQLGFYMLSDSAYIESLELTADGKQYSFSGNRVTVAFQELLFAIYRASSLELSCLYTKDGCTSIFRHNYPFDLCDSIRAYFEEFPEGKDNLFYSVFLNAEGNSGTGSIMAYGMKNGHFYCGGSQAQEISLDESDGNWVSAFCPVVCELTVEDPDTARRLVEVAQEIESRFSYGIHRGRSSEGPFYSPKTKYFNFCIGNAEIRSAAEMADFLALCRRLTELSGGEISFITEFEDLSGDDPRVLVLDLDKTPCTLQLYYI